MSDEKEQVTETENETEEVEKVESKKESKKEEVKVNNIDINDLKKEIGDAIRKEEKDKLYPQLAKLKEQMDEAQKKAEEAEAKLKEYEDKNLSVEEQATKKLSELEESNQRLQERMQELVEEANNKITSLQLELAKKEILNAYGDEIISELVVGTTLEELQQSAEKAHSMYITIAEKTKTKEKDVKLKDAVGTGINPTSEKINNNNVLTDIDSIKNPEDWKKHRDKFVQEAMKNL